MGKDKAAPIKNRVIALEKSISSLFFFTFRTMFARNIGKTTLKNSDGWMENPGKANHLFTPGPFPIKRVIKQKRNATSIAKGDNFLKVSDFTCVMRNITDNPTAIAIACFFI